MPRIKRFNKKPFRGNQFTRNVSDAKHSSSRPSPKKSSSSKKLKHSKLPDLLSEECNTGLNFIVDLELISNLVKSFSSCKECNSSECVEVRLEDDFKKGLVHRMIIVCIVCGKSESAMSSRFNSRVGLYDINIRYVYALRSIGKGLESGKMFSAVMNIAQPRCRMDVYHDKLLNATKEVCEASLMQAANEAIIENDGCADVAAAFDGTWQKRGYTSLNGVITVTSFDTGKVMDFECLSKYCNVCVREPNISDPVKLEQNKQKNKCSANYTGTSGGMEVVGARALCQRSVNKLGLRYVKYLGDGDSKGFTSVLESKPYGDNVQISKLECIGHIQKRVGSRLRRLKKDMKGKKLIDGKGLGGKGRLSDEEIDQLQRYYGQAIRNNLTSVDDMRKAIWATFYHKLSSDEKPQHELCPSGNESWCKYKKAQEQNIEYKHKNSLPEEVMNVIKPVYKDLSDPKLLKRCLHGKTQNPNESFNSVIWSRVPKTTFVGLKTLQIGVNDSVISFNEGAIGKANVFERLGITPGKFMIEGLKKIDENRIKKANKEVQEENKKKGLGEGCSREEKKILIVRIMFQEVFSVCLLV